jgi:hypothetical protein
MDRFAFIIFLRAGNQSAKMLRVNVVETMPFTRAIRKIAASLLPAASQLLLLMKWRSPRAFLQTDFSASRKSGCKKARVNLVDHMVLEPLAGVEAEHENDRTHAPVCEHADPNRDGTEATEAA